MKLPSQIQSNRISHGAKKISRGRKSGRLLATGFRWATGCSISQGRPDRGSQPCLAQDPLTLDHLRAWGNEDAEELLFVQFFFWNSGSPLQKSIAGLYRGILWEILRKRPDLIQDVFPGLWRDAHASTDAHGSQQNCHEFELAALQTAFDNLIRSQKLFSKHRVCFSSMVSTNTTATSGNYRSVSRSGAPRATSKCACPVDRITNS